MSKFHKSEEEPDMNFDDDNDNDKHSSNATNGKDKRIQDTNTYDTAPFDDLVYLTNEHHSKEREELIDKCL